MPPTHTDEGLRAAITLRGDFPQLGILLLSQWVHAGRALDLFRRGGAGLGYLLKDRVTDMDDFVDAYPAGGSRRIRPQSRRRRRAARRQPGP
jgi:hypothetical protein